LSFRLSLSSDNSAQSSAPGEISSIRTAKDVERVLRWSMVVNFVGLFGILFVCMVYRPLDPSPVYVTGLLLFGVPMTFYLVSAVRKKSAQQIAILHLVYRCSAVLLLAVVGALWANGAWDSSIPESVSATVLRSYESRGRRSTTYHLVVQSWRAGRTEEDLNVGSATYSRSRQNTRVRIEVHKGFFALPWYGRVTSP